MLKHCRKVEMFQLENVLEESQTLTRSTSSNPYFHLFQAPSNQPTIPRIHLHMVHLSVSLSQHQQPSNNVPRLLFQLNEEEVLQSLTLFILLFRWYKRITQHQVGLISELIRILLNTSFTCQLIH